MASPCKRCGATLDPLAHACSFCGLTTPAGVAAHERAQAEAGQRAAWHAHAEHLGASIARQTADKAATSSLLWSIAGTILCCLPLGVVGVAQGIRARKAAARGGVEAPGKAVAGIVLGVVSSLVSVTFITWAIVRDNEQRAEASARIAALEASSAEGAKRDVLGHETACALAEVHARRNGVEKHRGHTLEDFECKGELRALGDGQARLEDFRFRSGDSKEAAFEVPVCFKRGAAWYVSDFGDACDAGEPSKGDEPPSKRSR